MQRTLSQNKRLHQLYNILRIDGVAQRELVKQFTGGRTMHSSEMETAECQLLISFLDTSVKTSDAANKMRRKMLSIAYQLGWTSENKKVDMDRIDNWCLKYGYLHKPFNNYTSKELPQLLTQFEQLL